MKIHDPVWCNVFVAPHAHLSDWKKLWMGEGRPWVGKCGNGQLCLGANVKNVKNPWMAVNIWKREKPVNGRVKPVNCREFSRIVKPWILKVWKAREWPWKPVNGREFSRIVKPWIFTNFSRMAVNFLSGSNYVHCVFLWNLCRWSALSVFHVVICNHITNSHACGALNRLFDSKLAPYSSHAFDLWDLSLIILILLLLLCCLMFDLLLCLGS